jgi:hypothetical protein
MWDLLLATLLAATPLLLAPSEGSAPSGVAW